MAVCRRIAGELWRVSQPRCREVLVERRAITLRGTVQGVGFRPFVVRLARRYQLGGLVCNDAGSVHIEGSQQGLDRFLDDLLNRPPPLAEIADSLWARTAALGERDFRIEGSLAGSARSAASL